MKHALLGVVHVQMQIPHHLLDVVEGGDGHQFVVDVDPVPKQTQVGELIHVHGGAPFVVRLHQHLGGPGVLRNRFEQIEGGQS